ncbi:flagellar basal body-associated FliL family protein [Methylobacterium tardum]|uniref:flagellar basal body-associated FliL family protein n=1 Tax=Methylobacterium tardum TaxID=374432 RepID=UPI00201FEBA6|nr:flagellar basal body-associated FliL family protein [Methylobacterium tardum]URD38669.1 flagellar basal body-associated FliL family protein [Methylobacterium tardum]
MASDKAARSAVLRWLLLLAMLTVLAVGVGGASGLYMIAKVEKAVDERKKAEEEQVQRVATYDAGSTLTHLGTVVTNLASPSDVWIRLESSVVVKTGTFTNPEAMAAEIRQDILGYLRTLSIAQIEGPSGLSHLREDLTERVQVRSKGRPATSSSKRSSSSRAAGRRPVRGPRRRTSGPVTPCCVAYFWRARCSSSPRLRAPRASASTKCCPPGTGRPAGG